MGGVPGLWVAAVALPLVHLGVTRLVPCSEPCGAGSGYTGGGAAWIPGGPVVPTGLFLSLDTSAINSLPFPDLSAHPSGFRLAALSPEITPAFTLVRL